MYLNPVSTASVTMTASGEALRKTVGADHVRAGGDAGKDPFLERKPPCQSACRASGMG